MRNIAAAEQKKQGLEQIILFDAKSIGIEDTCKVLEQIILFDAKSIGIEDTLM